MFIFFLICSFHKFQHLWKSTLCIILFYLCIAPNWETFALLGVCDPHKVKLSRVKPALCCLSNTALDSVVVHNPGLQDKLGQLILHKEPEGISHSEPAIILPAWPCLYWTVQQEALWEHSLETELFLCKDITQDSSDDQKDQFLSMDSTSSSKHHGKNPSRLQMMLRQCGVPSTWRVEALSICISPLILSY